MDLKEAMRILEITQEGESFLTKDGCHWDSFAEAVAMGIGGFCGCGVPDAAGEYVMKGLALVDSLSEKVWKDQTTYAQWASEKDKHFGGQGPEYFFWYWASDLGLLEHGGSVPGWLTDKGKAFLFALRSGEICPDDEN